MEAQQNSNKPSEGRGRPNSIISSKTGFLTKRSISSMDAFANWKQRFFVLTDATLSYYKQGGGLFASSKEDIAHLKGEIELTANTIVRKSNIDDKVNCFEVLTPVKKLYAQADSSAEMNEWIDALRAHITAVKNGVSFNATSKFNSRSSNIPNDAIPQEELSRQSIIADYPDSIPDATKEDPVVVNDFIKKLVQENRQLRDQLIRATQGVSINRSNSTDDIHINQQKFAANAAGRSDSVSHINDSGSRRPTAAVLDLRDVRKKQIQLWDAAEEGRLDQVNALLQASVIDVNGKGINQYTALHLAVSKNQVEVANSLLNRGAFVNARTANRQTPMHLACSNGYLDCVKLLIENHGNPNLTDEAGNGAIHSAAEGGHIEVARLLLKHGARKDVANASGSLPMHLAPIGHPIRVLLAPEGMDEDLIRTSAAGGVHNQDIAEARKDVDDETLNVTFRNKYETQLALGPRDFEFVRVLGRGAFAKVYLVRGKGSSRDKWYALKAYNKNAIVQKNQARYILTEKTALQACSDHPFIVTLHYSFQSSDRLFLVMDYCGGGDLLSALTRRKSFTEVEASFYIAEIVLALSHLHSKNMVFRDLKPENVVLDTEGHALLTDFGISKEGILDHCSANTFCGSPMYLAPEMLSRSGHGQPLDWYSVGALTYELLTGLPPYYTNDKKQLFHNILKGQLPIPDYLSPEAKSLLQGLLHRDPSKRLGSGPKGSKEIMEHPFFRNIDWQKLYDRKIPPPFKPQIQENSTGVPDISNFPQAFTDQVISDMERGIDLSATHPNAKKEKEDRRLFKDFDFQPDLALNSEAKEFEKLAIRKELKGLDKIEEVKEESISSPSNSSDQKHSSSSNPSTKPVPNRSNSVSNVNTHEQVINATNSIGDRESFEI